MSIAELLQTASARGIVVAPKPEASAVAEGWMSRIAAVERLLAGSSGRDAIPRVYLNPHHQDDRSPDPQLAYGSDGIPEIRVDARWSSQFALLRDLVTRAPWVYVHTVHLARFLVPFLDRARVFIDIHGIVPEEEAMYGNTENALFYEAVERRIWHGATGVLTVSSAMRDHLDRKHGARAGRSLVLPIFEDAIPAGRSPARRADKPTVIYAGGAQRWQCVDEMIALAAAVGDRARWMFLSHEPHEFESRLAARGIRALVEVRTVAKGGLEPFYRAADYGLVIREPIPVNRVSCPTKLIEYLKFGVVPVVKFADLGDFVELGYRAVTVEDFVAGRLPGPEALESMRRANTAALERLAATFTASASTLRAWLAEPFAPPALQQPELTELSTAELAAGGTAVATVTEVNPVGTARNHSVNTATWRRDKRFALSGGPLRELRLRPVQGPFVARARGASFVSRTGEVVEAKVAYRGARCTADLCVCTPEHAGDIVLMPSAETREALREAVVSIDLVAAWPEASAAFAVAPIPGTRHRAASQGVREWVDALREYRRRIRRYWRV